MEESGGECGNSEFYESECCESESGEGWESEPEASDGGSLYLPTPERPRMVASPIDLPNVLGFIELDVVNKIRSCTTPGCKAPVGVKCRGLGGVLAVSYSCDGCALKGAVLETQSNYVHQLGSTNTVSMCVQVAFIIAGSTHAKRTCRYIQDGARSYKLHYILQNARLQGLYSCKNTCYCKINAMQD